MKNITLTIVLLLMTWSCNTQKNISKNEIKKDSIRIESNVKTDSIKEKKVTKITEPSFNKISVPCNSGDFTQTLKVGGIEYTITLKDGKVDLIVHTKEKKEESIEKTKSKSSDKNSLQRVATKSEILKTSLQKPSFWQALFSNIWKILFWTIFVLWFFNITPIKILKL